MRETPDPALLLAGGVLAAAGACLVALNVVAARIAAMREELREPLERARDQSRGLFEIAQANEALERMVRTLRETRAA